MGRAGRKPSRVRGSRSGYSASPPGHSRRCPPRSGSAYPTRAEWDARQGHRKDNRILNPVESEWSGQVQHVWQERALDTSAPLPTWQRIAFLALARHKADGHADFARGELARLLGEPPKKNNLNRELRQAVQYGWLDPSSCARCLVLPPHSFRSGPPGDLGQCVHARPKNLESLTDSSK